VSERLATEIELRKQIDAQRAARATAEQALHAKEEFLSTLSHEMRTPLNAVLGWARILLGRKTLDPELVERALHVIARNATAQAKMIDDMLDMARIVVGKLQLEMKMVDVVSIVLAAVDVVTPSAEAKRITIETNLDPAIPIVLGDADRLQQIVVNILSNAVKFTDAGGSVDIRLDMSGAVLRLAVTDTGRGISPAFLPHVFERFRQSDSSSTRRHGGLGLGLGLVRELVELHGGSVQAESAGEGRGACFIVRIPARTTPGVRRNSPAAQETGSLDGVRVLVIDDEPDARDIAVAALERGGAEVSAVASSAAAVSGILGAPADRLPHVVVSDIGMPMEDGYSFIRQLRALPPEHGGRIPAVTLTGYGAREDVNRALAAGYQMHVAKPIDPTALVAVVARLSKTVV
jgi:nitrogen-specific signal transduction histidine kinase/ActR/RegA family two-component response regulator